MWSIASAVEVMWEPLALTILLAVWFPDSYELVPIRVVHKYAVYMSATCTYIYNTHEKTFTK